MPPCNIISLNLHCCVKQVLNRGIMSRQKKFYLEPRKSTGIYYYNVRTEHLSLSELNIRLLSHGLDIPAFHRLP